MNCRLGDLAIVVNDLDYPNNNGCLLEIIARAQAGAYSIPADWVGRPLSTFDFGGRRNSPGDGRSVVYRDCELRPLRNSDGKDETLAWAELPKKVDAKIPATKQEEAVTATLQTSFLGATVQCAEQFVSGAWSLTVRSGDMGFDVRVDAHIAPPSGFHPGDRIRLEYKKGDNPFFGPFIKAHLLNA